MREALDSVEKEKVKLDFCFGMGGSVNVTEK
jgi:hypothetical protein